LLKSVFCVSLKKQICKQQGGIMATLLRTDKELIALGHSVVITRAIESLGGHAQVTTELGLSNTQTVGDWMRGRTRIPTKYLNRIRDLSKGKIKPQALLDEMDNFDYSA
jgi:DNA-binding transcriptional regulator YdaS (Cro superfamily)